MTVTVNGEARTVDVGVTVAAVVRGLSPAANGTAVALNGDVLPRGRWEQTALRDGDRVEVITAVQGG